MHICSYGQGTYQMAGSPHSIDAATKGNSQPHRNSADMRICACLLLGRKVITKDSKAHLSKDEKGVHVPAQLPHEPCEVDIDFHGILVPSCAGNLSALNDSSWQARQILRK